MAARHFSLSTLNIVHKAEDDNSEIWEKTIGKKYENLKEINKYSVIDSLCLD